MHTLALREPLYRYFGARVSTILLYQYTDPLGYSLGSRTLLETAEVLDRLRHQGFKGLGFRVGGLRVWDLGMYKYMGRGLRFLDCRLVNLKSLTLSLNPRPL